MTLRRLWPLGLLALALASTGCSGGRKNPPDATVRVLNVAPSFSSLIYRREQLTGNNPPTTLAYQGAGGDFPYDEDTYDFTVAVPDLTTAALTKDADTFSHALVAGTLYTFVYLESGGNVTHVILESPRIASDTTNAQVRALHADEGLPSVDVYLEAPGTVIAGATPWGTIGFKESLPQRAVPPGDYELAVTEAGNPANVLFTTQTFTLGAAGSTTLVLSPDAGEGIAPLNVVLLNAVGATPLVDPSFPASVRALNGATDQAPRDVAFDGQFTPPLFAAAAFGAPTSYQPLASGATLTVNVTPTGNPGVLEVTSSVVPVAATVYTTFFTGDAGALNLLFVPDDRRRVLGQAKVTFYDAAPVSTGAEPLFLAPGTDPATAPLTSTLLTPGGVQAMGLAPGTYELWLRQYFTTTILGGPVTVSVDEKGLYGIFLSNNADGTTIDIKLIDGFP